MDFKNYKVLDKGVVNNYTLVIINTVPKIYTSTKSTLDDKEREIMINGLLKFYFTNLEEIIQTKDKITDKAQVKQFKRDILNLYEGIRQQIPSLNTEWIKDLTEKIKKQII